nr:ABC transporter permease [Aromatoleum aromaticum]
MATIIAIVIAVPLGITAALTHGSWLDQAIRVLTVAWLSVPAFWLGMVLLLCLLLLFDWMPPIEPISFMKDPVANLTQLIWPALVVGARMSAMIARMLRSSLLEVLNEDYIRTARSKGVSERAVVVRHALGNALLPAVTVVGMEFAFLLGGLVVTEQVFNLNGIGKLLIQAVSQNDFTLIQGLVMLFAIFFVTVNFATDLLYAALDPRVRQR